jgi:hypothetical protein
MKILVEAKEVMGIVAASLMKKGFGDGTTHYRAKMEMPSGNITVEFYTPEAAPQPESKTYQPGDWQKEGSK